MGRVSKVRHQVRLSSAKSKRRPSVSRTSNTLSNVDGSRPTFQPDTSSRPPSRYSTAASSKAIENKNFLPSIPGISRCTSEAACETRPSNQNVTRPVEDTNMLADSLFHFWNCLTVSSSEERMFLLLSKRCGFHEAAYWCNEWNIKRPLGVLSALGIEFTPLVFRT